MTPHRVRFGEPQGEIDTAEIVGLPMAPIESGSERGAGEPALESGDRDARRARADGRHEDGG
jgi:hypothetical protein